MKKVYRKLTKDQKARGVIFSSQLKPSNSIHEVLDNDPQKEYHIQLLKNDSFFDDEDSPYLYNLIRK